MPHFEVEYLCNHDSYQGLFQDFAPGGQMLSAQILGGGASGKNQRVRKHAHLRESGGMLPQENF